MYAIKLMENTKRRKRFIKIATNRTNRILETLRLLGNCSNRSNYQYFEEDLRKIFSEIDRELRITKLKFLDKNKEKFTLEVKDDR
jgi:hypothetical protein